MSKITAEQLRGDQLAVAAHAALPFVAYAFSHGVIGAEEAGRNIEEAIVNRSPAYSPKQMAASFRAGQSTERMQGGEVQGDALAPLSFDQVAAMAPAGLTWDETGAWGMGYEACRKAALAARQPEVWNSMDTAPKDGTEVLIEVELRAGVPGKCLVGHYMRGGHCIEDHPPIAAGWYFWNGCAFDMAAKPIRWRHIQPAQGIDLGKLQRLSEAWIAKANNLATAPHVARALYACAKELRDEIPLTDDQRDAAPGVGS